MGRRYVRLPRPGTITLFAALDMATVIAQCRWHHRHQEYWDFLRKIEKNVSWELDVHVIVDHDATHKHPCVKHWLAARPRFHVHFTQTYASWLNQVEIWFNRINWGKDGSVRACRKYHGTSLRVDCHRRSHLRQSPATIRTYSRDRTRRSVYPSKSAILSVAVFLAAN